MILTTMAMWTCLPVLKLFVNDGNGLFTDSSEAFGSGTAIWADVDNDRDLDLYIHANSFGNAQFYQNQGNGWSEQSASMGITIGAEAASWGDYDQDGDLDLFLTRTAERYQPMMLSSETIT